MSIADAKTLINQPHFTFKSIRIISKTIVTARDQSTDTCYLAADEDEFALLTTNATFEIRSIYDIEVTGGTIKSLEQGNIVNFAFTTMKSVVTDQHTFSVPRLITQDLSHLRTSERRDSASVAAHLRCMITSFTPVTWSNQHSAGLKGDIFISDASGTVSMTAWGHRVTQLQEYIGQSPLPLPVTFVGALLQPSNPTKDSRFYNLSLSDTRPCFIVKNSIPLQINPARLDLPPSITTTLLDLRQNTALHPHLRWTLNQLTVVRPPVVKHVNITKPNAPIKQELCTTLNITDSSTPIEHTITLWGDTTRYSIQLDSVLTFSATYLRASWSGAFLNIVPTPQTEFDVHSLRDVLPSVRTPLLASPAKKRAREEPEDEL